MAKLTKWNAFNITVDNNKNFYEMKNNEQRDFKSKQLFISLQSSISYQCHHRKRLHRLISRTVHNFAYCELCYSLVLIDLAYLASGYWIFVQPIIWKSYFYYGITTKYGNSKTSTRRQSNITFAFRRMGGSIKMQTYANKGEEVVSMRTITHSFIKFCI